MSAPYEIRRYSPEFRDQAIALQKHFCGDDMALSDDYFRWKYEENPYADDVPVYVALFDGQVAGMRGFMGAEWQIGTTGESVVCPCTSGLLVDADHRGRGLFWKIMSHVVRDVADRGYPFLANLSASPITFLSALKMGWQLVGPYQSWRWQTRAKSLANTVRTFINGKPVLWRYQDRRIPILERESTVTYRKLGEYFEKGESASQTPITFSLDIESSRMAETAQRLSTGDNRLRHQIDSTYLTWRYRNPLGRFAFLYAGGDVLSGYLVLHMDRAGHAQDVAIVDWRAENVSILDQMVSALQHSGAVDSLTIWSATLADDVMAMLRENQFQAMDESRGIQGYTPGVLIKTNHAGRFSRIENALGQDPATLAAWDLRMIFSDNF